MADIFQGNFQKRDEEIKKLLRIEDSFDLIRRRFVIGGRQAAFYTVDGFLKGEVTDAGRFCGLFTAGDPVSGPDENCRSGGFCKSSAFRYELPAGGGL